MYSDFLIARTVWKQLLLLQVVCVCVLFKILCITKQSRIEIKSKALTRVRRTIYSSHTHTHTHSFYLSLKMQQSYLNRLLCLNLKGVPRDDFRNLLLLTASAAQKEKKKQPPTATQDK